MKKVLLIAATRPNFVKMAPLYLCLSKQPWCDVQLLYIAQHPPGPMTTEIAESLGVRAYDHCILVEEDVSTMLRLGHIADKVQEFLAVHKQDIVVVPGDVDASVAVAISTARSGAKLVHLEAGLRSFDRKMPEELNRILIDSIADLHLAPSKAAFDNLVYGEGQPTSNVRLVGNIMIDTLRMIYKPEYVPGILKQAGIKDFALCTFHRPSNVDSAEALERLLAVIVATSRKYPVLFAIHPRTRKNIKQFGLHDAFQKVDRLHLCDPIPYIDFIHVMAHASIIMTDSGGVQEEAAYLKKHCFTFRDNTERPQTIECGSNRLISFYDFDSVFEKSHQAIGNIPLWDGLTSERVALCLRTMI
jgi:UDP-N-acetylglucosamine 2-epimerase (non-hydrolysing)